MSDRETQQRGVDFKIEGAVEASAAKGDASSERVAEQGVRVGSIPTPAPAPSHTSPSDRETQQHRVICPKCERGSDACEWCASLAHDDWRAICDCGLHDFGAHLFNCESRSPYAWVVAADFETARMRRL